MENPISLNTVTPTLQPHDLTPQFTCLSCLIGFPTGEAQREHYRSDHHRYNMKVCYILSVHSTCVDMCLCQRRVAGLPPINATTFNQKVLDKRAETALTTADRGATCEVCKYVGMFRTYIYDPNLTHKSKVYSTENAYRSHIVSKKHKENELKLSQVPASGNTSSNANGTSVSSSSETSSSTVVPLPLPPTQSPIQNDHQNTSEEENSLTLDERLAAARSRLGPLSCLFCAASSSSVADNLDHMATSHGFFIPDAQYLEDAPGLITYLAEKVAIGNACLYCNREYGSLHAVRKHMIDKSHTKIAYDSERERLEISDFYDFTASYPDPDAAGNARRNKATRRTLAAADVADDQWDDDDDDENVTVGDDESVYDVESEDGVESEDDALPDNNLKYGETPYELVLPSGTRIGHRTMAKYYKQNFDAPLPARHSNSGGAPSGREMVQRILAEKDGVLVPASGGGFGAFGKGTLTIKARNRGEAKEAGRHVREFRDQKRREHFKTAVAFRHNSQKHFRDPLLQ